MRSIVLLVLLVIASPEMLVRAQETSYWTFERVDGPVEPVSKVALAGLRGADPQARIRHVGAQLQVRIDSSVPEARILQILQESTGGPFRSVRASVVDGPIAENAHVVGTNAGSDMRFDLASLLTERPSLLNEFGAPVLPKSAGAEESVVYHTLLKNWLIEHPEQQAALREEILKNAIDE